MPVKKRGTSNPLNRYISEGRYGYIVRYKTRRGYTTKHFAITAHGGKRKCLAAAREFRDEVYAKPVVKRAATKKAVTKKVAAVTKRAVKKKVKASPKRTGRKAVKTSAV
ncbi:MAG TPA: hypothetical protein VIQ62_02860 [Burkholderiales bacterium]|jgi:hypothetical protein